MPIQLNILEPVGGLTDQTARIAAGEHKGLTYSIIIGQRATLNVTFEIAVGDTYDPVIGAPVWYYETASGKTELVFAGKIVDTEPHWFADGAHYVKISCVSFESLFDTVLAPAQVFTGQTAAQIFTALVTPVVNSAPLLIQFGSIIGGLVIDKLIFDGTTYLKDALDQLVATMSNESSTNWAWGIDLTRFPLPAVYFRPPDGLGITVQGPPFSVEGELMWDTLDFEQNLSDFVNQVRISASQSIFPPSTWVFQTPNPSAPNQNIFTLPFPPSQVTAARITKAGLRRGTPGFTGNAPAAALGALLALPNTGDTMTIGNVTYTFVAALDNGIANQILIAPTTAATVTNINDAIMANQLTGGIGFSWPTIENDLANADNTAPLNFLIWAKYCGDAGNSIGATSTVAGMQFTGVDGLPTTHLTYGTDPIPGTSDIVLSCVNSTDVSTVTQPSLLYQAGDRDVTVVVPEMDGIPPQLKPNPMPLDVFWWLEVQYQRVGGGAITVENTALVNARAAIEHSSGQYQRSITANSVADLATAYQAAQKLLAQYSVIPATVKFDSYRSFFHINDYLFFDLTQPTTVLNARQFVIQEVQGEYVPGMDQYPQYSVKHSITAISGSTITNTSGSTITNTVTDIDFWVGLAQRAAPPAPPLAPPLAPQQPLPMAVSVFDATVANDIADHHPLPQTYEVRQVTVTPRIVPVLDLTGELWLAAVYNAAGTLIDPPVELTPFIIPAASHTDVPIVITADKWTHQPPMVMPVGRILTINVTGGDGAQAATGVFVVRLDVVPRPGTGLPPNMIGP